MAKRQHTPRSAVRGLPKCPTGIQGIDEITGGGLPQGRPTLVCGAAGCGKTLLAMQFLVRGATDYHEPGVFMAFEETAEELTKNVGSLGFNLPALIRRKLLFVDYVHVERSEIEETGEYDLEGLFIRLGLAIDSIGAKRVVLDTVESLFAALPNMLVLRAELRRLFRWLKDKGVTVIITAEQGSGKLTRHDLEEYVSDCVLRLDHRVTDLVSTRRLRVIKYRGSVHGTNEYPFLIDETGIFVLPITSLDLQHPASTERISTGISRLDTMLGGRGYFRGSTVLVSGTAGTGKSSLAAHFVDAACRRGERCLYFAFEESLNQITRNMHSIGLNLLPWVRKGRLHFYAARPTLGGLEQHLAAMGKMIDTFRPHVVVLDPITNFVSVGEVADVKSMLMRLVDALKRQRITTLFTSLTAGDGALEQTTVGISSLMDTWLLLSSIELNGERNRGLHVIKSRGMAHSNQIREFLITDHGIELIDVSLGPGGVLTGSARLAQTAHERDEVVARRQVAERRQHDLERKHAALDAQIAVLRAEYEREADEVQDSIVDLQQREQRTQVDRAAMTRQRKADKPPAMRRTPRMHTRGRRK
jgi:circadian clock protein KaiC